MWRIVRMSSPSSDKCLNLPCGHCRHRWGHEKNWLEKGEQQSELSVLKTVGPSGILREDDGLQPFPTGSEEPLICEYSGGTETANTDPGTSCRVFGCGTMPLIFKFRFIFSLFCSDVGGVLRAINEEGRLKNPTSAPVDQSDLSAHSQSSHTWICRRRRRIRHRAMRPELFCCAKALGLVHLQGSAFPPPKKQRQLFWYFSCGVYFSVPFIFLTLFTIFKLHIQSIFHCL